MERDLIGVPVSAKFAAIALGQHKDYRVLRRMAPMLRRDLSVESGTPSKNSLIGVALDIETTGMDVESCSIIELAIQRFRFDDLGRIVGTGRPHAWLEDPGGPLSTHVSRLTGLSDDDLAGCAIVDAEAIAMILGADVVVSHNARFDRPFLERRLPGVAGRRWMCSMADVDWAELGFDGRSLGYLVGQCGWFYDAHRAASDVTALLHLLDHKLNTSGTVLRELVRGASRPSWLIEAVGAKLKTKDVLRCHGYRWRSASRVWAKEVVAADLNDEIEWAVAKVYEGAGRPVYSMVTWEQRYAEGP